MPRTGTRTGAGAASKIHARSSPSLPRVIRPLHTKQMSATGRRTVPLAQLRVQRLSLELEKRTRAHSRSVRLGDRAELEERRGRPLLCSCRNSAQFPTHVSCEEEMSAIH